MEPSRDAHPEHAWRVVVADNASTDRTLEVARELEGRFPGRVVAQHIPVKGRGIALRTTWLTSDADAMAYMDVDLSTDLEHIPALVDPIARGYADLTYGTRLHPLSRTERSLKREITSRGYIAILRLAGLRVTDAQCGFKAISREAARALLPLVQDTQWFWDTELLWVAQANGYRMADTRVRIIKTATDDLKGVWRLKRGGLPRVAGR